MGRDRDLRCFSLVSPGVVDVRMCTLYIHDLALAYEGLPLCKQPRGARAFHHIALAILFVSTICYFAMASDLGKTPIFVEFRFDTHGPDRDIFVRFVFIILVSFRSRADMRVCAFDSGCDMSNGSSTHRSSCCWYL
jgi:hypothetical protein